MGIQVSFIALSYNHSKFLTETLDSIINQKGDFEYELIITDDASSDNSVNVINDWISRNNKPIEIKTVFNETNLGLCTTLNKAIRLASGTWIKPIACDDVLENEFLSEWFKVTSKNEAIGLVCTDMSQINSESKIFRESNWDYNQSIINNEIVNDIGNLYKAQYLNAPTLIYKRELWEQLNGYDESLIFEDWDFLLRAKKTTNFHAIKKSLVRYRMHENNMHLNFKTNVRYALDSIALLKKHLSEGNKKIIRNKVIEEISKLIPVNENKAIEIWENEYNWLKCDIKVSPLVSVLLPVFNLENYIENALKSILLQTYSNIEIIVVNDGSSDGTVEIIKTLLNKDNRIKLLNNEQNIGLIKSLNFGLIQCTGEYIARMDGDDISSPQRIEKQIDFLLQYSKYAAVSSWMQTFNENGMGNILRYRTKPEEIKACLPFYSPVSHPASLFRSDILKTLGYKEEYKYCEDYDLWFRLMQKYNIGVVQEVLYNYRNHSEQTTNPSNQKISEKSLRIIAENILYHLGVNYTSDTVDFHLRFCMQNELLKSTNELIEWDRHLRKLLKGNRGLYKDEVFIDFVFKNYWQTNINKLYKELTWKEIFQLFLSPFCKYSSIIKLKFLLKKSINK